MSPKRDVAAPRPAASGGMPGYEPVEPIDVVAKSLGIPVERIVKLDGNENPYGPSPRVAEALARVRATTTSTPTRRSAASGRRSRIRRRGSRANRAGQRLGRPAELSAHAVSLARRRSGQRPADVRHVRLPRPCLRRDTVRCRAQRRLQPGPTGAGAGAGRWRSCCISPRRTTRPATRCRGMQLERLLEHDAYDRCR